MISVANPPGMWAGTGLSAVRRSIRLLGKRLPGIERWGRLYRMAAIIGLSAPPLSMWLGSGPGVAGAVSAALIVDHSLWLGRNFLVWSAIWLLIWSIWVQAGAFFLPLHGEFWRVLVAVWQSHMDIDMAVGVPLLAGPVGWFALGFPGVKGLNALFERIQRDRVEYPIFVAGSTVYGISWAGPETRTAPLIGALISLGILGMVMKFLKRKLVGRVATIEEKIEAIETAKNGMQVREINVLALGQAGRPKRFVLDDDDQESSVGPVTSLSHAAQAPVLPMPAQEAPEEEPVDLTPNPDLWDEGGDEESLTDGGGVDEGVPLNGDDHGEEEQPPGDSDIPQDFVFDDSLFASESSLGSEAGPLGDEVSENMNLEEEVVGDEARRGAFMDARKLVDAYHLLSEQAATSDDPVSVREAVGTLADLIANTTQLSRDCLLEIDHPEVIDSWILSATLDEDADIEREIYDHFMSPVAPTDEFATPVLDTAEHPSSPSQDAAGGAQDWGMSTTIVLDAPVAEEGQPAASPSGAAPGETPLPEEEVVTATAPPKPAIPTPLLDGDLTEDERSLLEFILEDQDLLENGLQAIADYDFRPKALSLLSGRVGALLRARWSEVVANLRLQRFFMTVLERASDELYEKVEVRRSICSVRFTTALVHEETETFMMEVGEKLNAGIDTKDDYDFLLGCRDKVESLSEAFGETVPSVNELAEKFRSDLAASGRVYAEPLTPVVTELTGVHAIDAGSIKRGMGHVLASSLDQNDRDLLEGFIVVAKSVKSLDQRVKMESMRRQTDVSTHPLYDSVMALKQEALGRAKALQDRVTLSGGGETRLRNMLLSGGEDAVEVFTNILGSATEVANYRIDGKSKSALLASLESQMAALNRQHEEHVIEKRELRKQADANLTSDSIEAHINLMAEVFSAKKNGGNHKMVHDADTVLTRLKTGPAQAAYRTKDVTYAFCFIYGQNRNDWYIKDAEMLLCKSNSLAISLKQARAQVGGLAEVQTDKVRMRFILVHGNVESGMGIAFSAKQALEHPELLLKASELDRGLEKTSADGEQVRPAA